MKNIKMGTYFYNDETYSFNFATDLSAYRKMMFVNYVVDSIVDDNRYNSIVRDLVFDFGLVSICTDINTSFINQIDDDGNLINPMIFIEQFLEKTNVVDIVKSNMEVGLLEELNNAVDKSIEYQTGIHPNPINDALASLLSTLEKKVSELDTDSMMKMAQKFASMAGKLTPETVVSAYINGDVHKKNLEEIAENKKNQKNNESKKNEIKIDESLGEAIRTVVKENRAEKSEVVE